MVVILSILTMWKYSMEDDGKEQIMDWINLEMELILSRYPSLPLVTDLDRFRLIRIQDDLSNKKKDWRLFLLF